ncbi:MAG: NADH-quinone oxidoreductase subunit NuoF [bacterium]|nr:NADH-quinone oxidoreductase subunit NuoF [bacterium]
MPEQAFFRCCHRCWHSAEMPCPEVVACRTAGPLCHDDAACFARLKAAGTPHAGVPRVRVGTGTCGLGAGAGRTLAAVRDWLRDHDTQACVSEVGCIGYCVGEPLVDIELPGRTRVAWQHVTADKVPALLAAALGGETPAEGLLGQLRGSADEAPREPWPGVPYLDEHPFFAPQTRWVLANCGIIDPDSLDEYLARGGYRALSKVLQTWTPQEVVREVLDSGLRGRGGGGFPTGRKWGLALDAPGEHRYLICNADEGDPGAFMDRAVIEGDPHRLLEGMAIAAYAIGAQKAYVYIRAEYPLAVRRLHSAIAAARACGLLGRNILDSGFSLEIKVKMGAGAFVCGEETALIHSIEGKRGMPRPRPPFPVAKGLFGKPTVINNVETLANVPGILDRGAGWFNALGTESSKGTKVFALSGRVERTGLVEVAMGTSIRDIVFAVGGGIPEGRAYKAVQIGGPSGGCIPESHLDTLVDYASLQAVGAMMGSGGLVVMDERTCMVDVAKFFMDFIQRESCGKCIPCREGTRHMLEILQAITRARGREDETQTLERFQGVVNLTRLARVIQDTSLCGLGQSAPNPVLSTLRWFPEEYEEHVFDRHCRAGVCLELRHYHIDEDKCKGCGLCRKRCPTGAIVGSPREAHFIREDKCIACGACVEACHLDAVLAD